MFSTRTLLCSSVAIAALLLATSPGHAQSTTPINNHIEQLERQMQELQHQIQDMKSEAAQERAAMQQERETMQKAQAQPVNAPKVTQSSGNRFGLQSADGQNSIALTGRLHLDMADYLNVQQADKKSSLTDGFNARRARLGVVGKFLGDWNYAFVADAGGSTDATPSTMIENAFVSYGGFKSTAIDLGYIDVPWTLDEATSSNDIMFLERSSSQAIATSFGAGDARSALGGHYNTDRLWGAFYFTGPNAGASHTGSNQTQTAMAGRLAYQIVQTDEASLHIGANGLYTFNPRSSTNTHTFTLSDRPELRVDSASFLNTGAVNANSGSVLGLEGAGAYQNFFMQGEYYHYMIDQFATTSTVSAPELNFDGGYVEASYSLGGKRHYNPGAGAYTGVIPDHPFTIASGDWGAFELAGRYSVVDLNSKNITGGEQTAYTAGINWYPNKNVRFLLDYIHADVTKPNAPAPLKMDAIALRTQIAF